MVKSELIQRILEQNRHLHQRDIEKIVQVILDALTTAMARGDRVELRGVGAFSVKNRAARAGRNPRTQAYVSVKEKAVPCFKTGKECGSGSTARRRPEAPASATLAPRCHLPLPQPPDDQRRQPLRRLLQDPR